jgi:DNA-binding response OmpR family regulator
MENKKMRILIAEDEKSMAHALELKLNHAGFEAESVGDGEECLDRMQKEPFDLVLLDLVMPKVDGFTVLETLQRQGNTTPVVVLSNLSQTEDENRARALGACGFFIKSNTSLADIVVMVNERLGLQW